MLIWINLYFIIYILLILTLHYILNRVAQGSFSKKSLIFSHLYIIKYSKIKNIYLCVLLSLAGLPPFLIFFIKANYIISFIGSISFYSNIIIFFCYFINMLFYTQLYLYKNYVFDDMDYMDMKVRVYDSKIIYKIVLLLIITALSIICVSDIYYISILFFS